jgi:hypothetical protein
MPWFGVHEHWTGSLCLLHVATEWSWPQESTVACGSGAEAALEEAGRAVRLDNHGGPPPVVSAAASSSARPSGSAPGLLAAVDLLRSHRGNAPGTANNWTTCPAAVAEAVLGASPAAAFDDWLEAAEPDLSLRVYPRKWPPVQPQPPPPPPPDVGVPPPSSGAGGGGSGDRGRADPRGPDAALYAWGLEAFGRRMASAAALLAAQGVDAGHLPPHLSPDCFARPPPDGFALTRR